MGSRGVLLFDLDGVLLDSAKLIRSVLGEMLADRGCPPVGMNELHPLLNCGGRAIVNGGLGAAARDEAEDLAEFRRRYAQAGHTPNCLYPRVAATLGRLAATGWRMGVCTNKPELLAVGALKSTGILSYFEIVAADNGQAQLKPDPALLFVCLEAMGASAPSSTYVGDSHTDHVAADAAGMAFVRASYGYPSAGSDVDWRAAPAIAAIDDLPCALEGLRPLERARMALL